MRMLRKVVPILSMPNDNLQKDQLSEPQTQFGSQWINNTSKSVGYRKQTKKTRLFEAPQLL